MIERVSIPPGYQLQDYERYAGLGRHACEVRQTGCAAAKALAGRTVWHISSTAQGGGVAEMLPRVLSLARQVGLRVEWVVIHPEEPRFFSLTKQIHNMIHGRGASSFQPGDRELYAAVSRRLADELRPLFAPHDLLVVHDPQPLGAGALLSEELGLTALWRCHIGLDRKTPSTEAAWAFLEPWTRPYSRAVFSLRSYVPDFLKARSVVIHPAIDPLSHKNRDLSIHKLTGILVSGGLLATTQPTLAAPFSMPALRLQADGHFRPAAHADDIGLLFRPLVVQVSRWDRLKGFLPLLQAFEHLKCLHHAQRDRRRLEILRLVLAGPDPTSVQDDPEALDVLESLAAAWRALPPAVRDDVAILALPLVSRKENALMVNVLQRCASVVVQNSLEEGFGLTVTEAMWKARPILGSRAAGIRTQVRDGREGRLIADPEDTMAIAVTLDEMLHAPKTRETWGYNGRVRAAEHFHILRNVDAWLHLYQDVIE